MENKKISLECLFEAPREPNRFTAENSFVWLKKLNMKSNIFISHIMAQTRRARSYS